jgi:hypothetical protein
MELFRKKPKQTFNGYPYEYFFIHKLFDKEKKPEQAIALIQQYILLLRHQYFQKHFTHIKEWNDFCIPIRYQYLLSSDQINLLQTLFHNRPISFEKQVFTFSRNSQYYIPYKEKNEYLYVLPSKRDYNRFLKLPLEIRRCLACLPQSKIEVPLRDVDINQYKAIGFIRKTDMCVSREHFYTKCVELATIIQDKSRTIRADEHRMYTAPQLLTISDAKYLLHDPYASMSTRFKKKG